MNLSFAYSLRMGEILGLTWDNVHISEDDIATANAKYLYPADPEKALYSQFQIITINRR